MEIVAPPTLAAALASETLPESGAVIDVSERTADWAEAKATLMNAFAVSQRAAVGESSIVYVVHSDDLLGRRGSPSAMVATGLLSAARTAAIEMSRKAAVVNVVAVGDQTDPAVTARWVGHLLDPTGPTGEVVRLDAGHLGKALP